MNYEGDYTTRRNNDKDPLPLTSSNLDNMNKKNSGVTKLPVKNVSDNEDIWGDTSSISTSRSNYQDTQTLVTMNTQATSKSKNSLKERLKQQKSMKPADKTGFLFKPQKHFSMFTKRYCILKEGVLYMYHSEEDSVCDKPTRPCREIYLKGFNLIPVREKTQFILESGSSEKYILDVKSKFLYDSWHQKFVEHVAYANGYYHLVVGEHATIDLNKGGVQEIKPKS